MRQPCLKSLAVLGLCLGPLVAASAEDGWRPLFNGEDLSGWQGVRGPTDNWKVADGVLVCTGEPGSKWLATEDTFADFELELEFKVSPGGNSGVFIRVPLEGRPAFDGMEIQIADDYAPRYVERGPIKHTGALYGVLPPSKQATKRAGQWQSMRIICAGRTVQVFVNGRQVIDADLDDYRDQFDQQPGLTREEGHVGLQNHKSPIEFRNIRIRRIDAK